MSFYINRAVDYAAKFSLKQVNTIYTLKFKKISHKFMKNAKHLAIRYEELCNEKGESYSINSYFQGNTLLKNDNYAIYFCINKKKQMHSF